MYVYILCGEKQDDGDRYPETGKGRTKNWTDNMHWVGIIGYRKYNGKDQIFVSDTGHGLTGWYNINEFDYCHIDKVTIITKK